jgi:hypothetical protein
MAEQRVIPEEREAPRHVPLDRRSVSTRALDFLRGRRGPPPAPLPAGTAPPAPAEGEEVVGICCSGGGIRSAAYNLGALQAMQEAGAFRRARYMTAVSGGSYIAASHAVVAGYSGNLLPDVPVYAQGSPEEQYLRNHSSYLAPTLRGKMNLGISILSGMAVTSGFIALFLYALSRPLGWLYTVRWLQPGLVGAARPQVVITTWMRWAAGGPALVGATMALVNLLTRPREVVRVFLAAWSRRLLWLAMAAFAFLIGLPLAVKFVRSELPGLLHAAVPFIARAAGTGASPDTQDGSTVLQVITAVAGFATIVAAVRAFVAKHRSYFAELTGAIIGPLAIVSVFLWYLNDATAAGVHSRPVVWWIVAAAAFVALYLVADLTRWSEHPIYKRRLSSAFAIQRVAVDPDTGRPRRDPETSRAMSESAPTEVRAEEVPYGTLLRLSRSQPYAWNDARGVPHPELIVCASANISDEGVTPPKRNTATFTLSATEVGGPLVGRFATAPYEQVLGRIRGRDFTLPAAMAVSGAALSPSMGRMTKRSLTFLYALLNVRLGVWLPNPNWIDRWRKRSRNGTRDPRLTMRPRPIYLVRELMGFNSIRDKFLYITDGGHYENLGLVELLRRGCTKIYCFDGSGGDPGTFFTLAEAIELARVEPDLRVEIDIDPTALSVDKETGFSTTDHVVGHFTYPGASWRGELVYCRAAVVAGAPYDVRSFQQRDRRFPHHSTADQWFDEYKFEAYRALGHFTAARAVAEDPAAGPEGTPSQ